MIIINVLLCTSSRSSAVGLTEGCFFKHSWTNSTKQEDLKFTHKKDNFNFLVWYYRAAQIKRICTCPTRSTFSQSKQNILLTLNFFNYYGIPNLKCSLWLNTCNWHVQLTLTLKMTTAKVVEMSVTVNNNSPIQDYVHPDGHTRPTDETTPGFKPFTVVIFGVWSTWSSCPTTAGFHRT